MLILPRDLALLSVTWSNPHSQAVLTDTNPAPEEQLTSVGRQKDGTVSIERHSLHKSKTANTSIRTHRKKAGVAPACLTPRGKLVGIVLGKIVDVEPTSAELRP